MQLATVVPLTFENDSVIRFALLPGADLHCARGKIPLRWKQRASVRLRCKIFARFKSRSPDNGTFFSPSPFPLLSPEALVKIRDKYTENFAMWFKCGFSLISDGIFRQDVFTRKKDP